MCQKPSNLFRTAQERFLIAVVVLGILSIIMLVSFIMIVADKEKCINCNKHIWGDAYQFTQDEWLCRNCETHLYRDVRISWGIPIDCVVYDTEIVAEIYYRATGKQLRGEHDKVKD